MNIADQDRAFGAEFFEPRWEISQEPFCSGRILDGIRPNVDDGGAGIDPVGLHEPGFAHRGYDNVSAANDVG